MTCGADVVESKGAELTSLTVTLGTSSWHGPDSASTTRTVMVVRAGALGLGQGSATRRTVFASMLAPAGHSGME